MFPYLKKVYFQKPFFFQENICLISFLKPTFSHIYGFREGCQNLQGCRSLLLLEEEIVGGRQSGASSWMHLRQYAARRSRGR